MRVHVLPDPQLLAKKQTETRGLPSFFPSLPSSCFRSICCHKDQTSLSFPLVETTADLRCSQSVQTRGSMMVKQYKPFRLALLDETGNTFIARDTRKECLRAQSSGLRRETLVRTLKSLEHRLRDSRETISRHTVSLC